MRAWYQHLFRTPFDKDLVKSEEFSRKGLWLKFLTLQSKTSITLRLGGSVFVGDPTQPLANLDLYVDRKFSEQVYIPKLIKNT